MSQSQDDETMVLVMYASVRQINEKKFNEQAKGTTFDKATIVRVCMYRCAKILTCFFNRLHTCRYDLQECVYIRTCHDHPCTHPCRNITVAHCSVLVLDEHIRKLAGTH
jgi:hypothetical protein